MKSNKYCVIMAGGVGSRLWPKSRKSLPKQFLDILGDGKSLLRRTFERFRPMVPLENFIVVTNKAYIPIVLEQLPELTPQQVLGEPVGRNTAPSLCYAAYSLLKIDPQAEMIVTPADHYIRQEDEFGEAVQECVEFASQRGALVTLGIYPTSPQTSYGYIQVSDSKPISKVKSFTEKPSLELAQAFMRHKEFYWNAGVFIWRLVDILAAIEQYMTDYHQLFSSIAQDMRTPREEAAIRRVFAECKQLSIDHGIMERSDNVYVKCGDFGWSDVGTWGSVYKNLEKDTLSNAVSGEAFMFSSRNCMVSMPEGKIAVVSGLNDYIVVDNDGVLMICPRSEELSIRGYIDEVKYNKGGDFL